MLNLTISILNPDGVEATRHDMADSRWREDFDKKLQSSSVLIVADYRSKDVLSGSPALIIGGGDVASFSPRSEPEQFVAESSNLDEFEHMEGIRLSAERCFFQRNPTLACRAKEVYGCACQVCGFDFVRVYGQIGRKFAEVHHLNPLSERPDSEWTEEVLTKVSDVA